MVLLLFFLFLLISLFLGDGKQPIVDVFWAMAILVLYGIRYSQEGRLVVASLPRTVAAGWMVLLVYYFVRTVFSDSLGLSITSSMRLVEAYLLYRLFYSVSDRQTVKIFTNGLLVCGIFAILASWIFMLFPAFTGFLPLMNLLYANYGHNYLAAVLLFIFPLVISQFERKPSRLSMGLIVVYTLGMIMTFARGVWVILVGYLLFEAFFKKNFSKNYKIIVGFISLIFIIVLAGGMLYSSKFFQNNFYSFDWFARQSIKPPINQDVRLRYWKQAIQAFGDRPWLGSGPGTFVLMSKRYEQGVNEYSWFAHSYLLETLVELGAAGTLVFLFLIGSIAWTRRSSVMTEERQPILWGIILTLLYSLFEFNLDFLVILLLAWSAAALIFYQKRLRADSFFDRAIFSFCIILVVFYYLTSVGSIVFSYFSWGKQIAPFVAPYNQREFIIGIESTDDFSMVDEKFSQVARFFHRKDPEVNFALAERYKQILSPNTALYYMAALRQDPKNIRYHASYLAYLASDSDVAGFKNEVVQVGQEFLPEGVRGRVDSVLRSFSAGDSPVAMPQPNFSTTDQVGLWLAKIYYLYGLEVIEGDPELTRRFWDLAKELNPQLSYYHIELANLLRMNLQDSITADRTLVDCQQYLSARVHCARVINGFYVPVGFFAKDIREFPLE